MNPQQREAMEKAAMECYPPDIPMKFGYDNNEPYRDAFIAGAIWAMSQQQEKLEVAVEALEAAKQTEAYWYIEATPANRFTALVDEALSKIKGGGE